MQPIYDFKGKYENGENHGTSFESDKLPRYKLLGTLSCFLTFAQPIPSFFRNKSFSGININDKYFSQYRSY